MRLVMFQFETKVQKCITTGITIFKISIWRGILWDIWNEIMFYLSARTSL